MVKKGGDDVSRDTPSEMDSLKGQLEKVELLLQEQSKESQELKAQVVESKMMMKSEIKDQLDDFLVMFRTMQASNTPPQANPVESVASNMAQVLQQSPGLGENSLALPAYSSNPAPPAFNLSVSPQSHMALPKPHASSSLHPQLHPKQVSPLS
jgi:uncharacterized coiled-coil protein SlyX